MPSEVEAEIRSRDPDAPSREYPYATLFRQLRDKMRDPPASPPPIDRFGRGEAAAIALARHLGEPILINEHRAARHAVDLGLQVVFVADVILTLRALDVISKRAARRKLDLIAPITARPIVLEARRVIDAL